VGKGNVGQGYGRHSKQGYGGHSNVIKYACYQESRINDTEMLTVQLDSHNAHQLEQVMRRMQEYCLNKIFLSDAGKWPLTEQRTTISAGKLVLYSLATATENARQVSSAELTPAASLKEIS
jgi:hypothetical protein